MDVEAGDGWMNKRRQRQRHKRRQRHTRRRRHKRRLRRKHKRRRRRKRRHKRRHKRERRRKRWCKASAQAQAQAKNDALRPLDKFMRPLKVTLDLKSSLYKEPDTPEDQTLMQLEQAKEAKGDMLKQSMLLCAAEFLQKAPPTEERTNKPPSPLLKKRIALWVDVVQMGWQGKMIHLVQRGAAIINPETNLNHEKPEVSKT